MAPIDLISILVSDEHACRSKRLLERRHKQAQFRYKLEGRDATWQDPGTRRQAFYNDLSPGKYRFQVIACNNDGVWNEQGATLGFSVLPAWYQTAWFRLLALTFGLGLALLLILFDRQRYATSLRVRTMNGWKCEPGSLVSFMTPCSRPFRAVSLLRM